MRDLAYKAKRALIETQKSIASLRLLMFIARARRRLIQRGFAPVRKLGAGKDGATFLCHKETDMVVVKYLSHYGKCFLPLTKLFIEKKIHDAHFYAPIVIDDEILSYPFEDLKKPEVNNETFKRYLLEICEFERVLVSHGMVYWDFGFSSSPNYMLTHEGQLKVIDYGGNAFLFLDRSEVFAAGYSDRPRPNLVFAETQYIAIQLLLHIITIGLGRKGMERYSSEAQDTSLEGLRKLKETCIREIKGTSYELIAECVVEVDLCSQAGWVSLAANIEKNLDTKVILTERADIDSISFTQDGVRVVGYQSYELRNDAITPLQNEHANDLWDTASKMKVVSHAFDLIAKNQPLPETFLDIGSNLGLYVFLANRVYGVPHAMGIDYNPDYVSVCNEIVMRLGMEGCNFERGTFGEHEQKHDIVLALGLIHHLYHRTEGSGSLEVILEKFSKITGRFLIIEFPTEKDSKARKWTDMPFRKKQDEYSLKRFEELATRYFGTVQKIGGTSPTRPIFLLEKRSPDILLSRRGVR
ncbi:MAG: hypothetical protein QG633_218 [Patescibacteria group bacterium]|nr:hypothetical protein [Patescibacteria group bacterium]